MTAYVDAPVRRGWTLSHILSPHHDVDTAYSLCDTIHSYCDVTGTGEAVHGGAGEAWVEVESYPQHTPSLRSCGRECRAESSYWSVTHVMCAMLQYVAHVLYSSLTHVISAMSLKQHTQVRVFREFAPEFWLGNMSGGFFVCCFDVGDSKCNRHKLCVI